MKSKPGFIKPAVLIIALTAAIYANSLQNSFLGDDADIIVNNGFIKSGKNLPLVFSRAYLTSLKDLDFLGLRNVGAGELSYRPVVTLSYFLDYRIWKLDPFGYHLTNLLLHTVNALLLFSLANLITANSAASLLAALLFALHPVNTEAVNAICFREDLLVFLFFVSALIFYIRAGSSAGIKKTGQYCASLGLFFLALFSKEMAVTLPLILILYDYYFAAGARRRSLTLNFRSRYLAYFLVLILYLWLWGVVFKNPNPLPKYPGGSFSANIMTMSTVIANYIRWIIVPIRLHFAVTEPHLILRQFSPAVLISSLVIICCLAAAIRMRRTAKEMSFALVWFFVTLLPVANIFPIRYIVALRYLYIPIAGFCLFLPLLQSRIKKISRVAIIVILVFYSFLSVSRNSAWKNDAALWSEIAKWYPDNHFAHYGLGAVYLKSGQVDKAMEELKISLRLNPGEANAHNLLAGCYAAKQMWGPAIREYENTLEFKPLDPQVYYNLGDLYAKTGSNAKAISAYQQAIAIDPKYLEAYNNLAAVYTDTGKVDAAILLWNKAVGIEPRFLTAHFNLAVFYFQNKQYDLAVKHCDALLNAGGKIDPKFLELLKPYRK
jgi:protein O-mannosyl-transferase